MNKEKHRINLLRVGKNTIGIFLIHKPFLQEVVMPSLEKLGVLLPNAGWALLGTVVVFIFLIAVVWLINRYVPSPFGRFPEVKESGCKMNNVLENA